jgi:hypothetical protein
MPCAVLRPVDERHRQGWYAVQFGNVCSKDVQHVVTDEFNICHGIEANKHYSHKRLADRVEADSMAREG